tara:strand:+ start:605 stop:895 length:291 start_codon:yes stop_codon:yes gene_type:complete
MSLSIKEAAKITGKTVPQFSKWTKTFQSDYIRGKNKYGDTVFMYTDGDVGAVALSASDVFPIGLKIQIVNDVQYCDIDTEALLDISDQIESEVYEE